MSESAANPGPRRPSLMPRGFVLAVAGVMAISVLGVAAARLGNMQPLGDSASLHRSATGTVSLSFVELADGDVEVFLDGAEEPAVVWEPIADSFQQGVLRVVKRQRKLAGVDSPVVIRVVAWDVGGLTVIDDATDAEIELAAFGADNLERFAVFFAKPESIAASRGQGTPSRGAESARIADSD